MPSVVSTVISSTVRAGFAKALKYAGFVDQFVALEGGEPGIIESVGMQMPGAMEAKGDGRLARSRTLMTREGTLDTMAIGVAAPLPPVNMSESVRTERRLLPRKTTGRSGPKWA